MSYSSFLINDLRPLVLDTSVLINLHACTYGERILAAIPNDIVVSRIVANELAHETSRKNGEHNFLNGLAACGKVTLTDMSDEEYADFYDLISASPSLDDGEAATIAIAAKRRFLPVIDEKKGRARASSTGDAAEPGWSLDILRHPSALAALGDQAAVEALYLALRNGRMRIPSSSAECVIAIIGVTRSVECMCLPGYGQRFGASKKTVSTKLELSDGS